MKRTLVACLSLLLVGLAGCETDPVSGPISPTESRLAVVGALPPGMEPGRMLGPAALDTEIVNESGQVIWSADGLGTTGASGTITVGKPSNGATLRKAVFAAATTPGGPAIPDNQITIDGAGVRWDQVIPGAIANQNHWADVTSMLRSKLDGAGPGAIAFTINEGGRTGSIDGSILVVVWEDPAIVGTWSVLVLFGAQSTEGDNFRVNLTDPFSGSSFVEMALGISFGCNASSTCGSGAGGQFSTVDVEGKRLTSSAGGQNDGEIANGALFTMGGTGDSNSNPDPDAKASVGFDPDDEYYNLTSFVQNGSTFFDVFTNNPSDDDNIFLALIYTNPPGSITSTPGPPPDDDDDDDDEAVSCSDVEQLIENAVRTVVNRDFPNFPEFVRNQFINTILTLTRPFINALTSGQVSPSAVTQTLERIRIVLATFNVVLDPTFISQLSQVAEDCREQNQP